MKRRCVALPLCLFLLAIPLPAQSDTPLSRRDQILDEFWEKASQLARLTGSLDPFASVVDRTGDGPGLFAAWMAAGEAEKEVYKTLFDLMEARVDKQVGSTPDSKGTTSLVMKGLAPKILGIAVENGGLAREVNGTVVTFRGTPVGIAKALQKKGFIDMYHDFQSDSLGRFADRFSFAVSFDTNRGASTPTLLANGQQVSSWSIRAELINQRNPMKKMYAPKWAALATKAGAYQEARRKLSAVFEKWREFQDWITGLQKDISDNVDSPFVTDRNLDTAKERYLSILKKELTELDELKNRPDEVSEALEQYARELSRLLTTRSEIIDYALKGTLLTAEWSVSRDPTLPDLSTVTAIFETALGARQVQDLTFNASVGFYHSQLKLPTGTNQFRDFKLSGQYDVPLGKIETIGSFILSLAGRIEHIPNDTMTPGTAAAIMAEMTPSTVGAMAVTPKGNIFVFQAKLTIPVKGSGVRIPLSFTISNRTELIKEKEVRGSIGLTFDLDAIFAKAFIQ